MDDAADLRTLASAFLDIPVKRNSQTVPNQASNQTSLNLFTKALSSRFSPDRSTTPDEQLPSYIDFKKALHPFLQQQQQSSGDSSLEVPTESHWYQLNQLRIHAGAPERSELGIERLLQYYAQLLNMEKKFPFDTLRVNIQFQWTDAMFMDKRGFQLYEKGAVLFNVAAIYSQLAASQSFQTAEGKKRAASFFQKSANLLFFCRDTLRQRFQVRLGKDSSDLSEQSLSALAEVMLGQAVECFYEKANEVNTSSPVTSQIATQAAGHYERVVQIAGQKIAADRDQLPKHWMNSVRTKSSLFTAIAHYHALSVMTNDKMVAERIARLSLAKSYIIKALKISSSGSSALKQICLHYSDVINSSLSVALSENYEKHHQLEIDVRLLSALKHPGMDLLPEINVSPLGDLDRFADIFQFLTSFSSNIDSRKFNESSLKLLESLLKELKDSLGNVDRSIDAVNSHRFSQSHRINDSRDKGGDELAHDRAAQLLIKLNLLKKDNQMLGCDEILSSIIEIHDNITVTLKNALGLFDGLDHSGIKEAQRHVIFKFLTRMSEIETSTIALREAFDLIEKKGILDWTESEMHEILPCIYTSQRESVYLEHSSKGSDIFAIKLESTRKQLIAEIQEVEKQQCNIAESFKPLNEIDLCMRKETLKQRTEITYEIRKEVEYLIRKVQDDLANRQFNNKNRRIETDQLNIIISFENGLLEFASLREKICLLFEDKCSEQEAFKIRDNSSPDTSSIYSGEHHQNIILNDNQLDLNAKLIRMRRMRELLHQNKYNSEQGKSFVEDQLSTIGNSSKPRPYIADSSLVNIDNAKERPNTTRTLPRNNARVEVGNNVQYKTLVDDSFYTKMPSYSTIKKEPEQSFSVAEKLQKIVRNLGGKGKGFINSALTKPQIGVSRDSSYETCADTLPIGRSEAIDSVMQRECLNSRTAKSQLREPRYKNSNKQQSKPNLPSTETLNDDQDDYGNVELAYIIKRQQERIGQLEAQGEIKKSASEISSTASSSISRMILKIKKQEATIQRLEKGMQARNNNTSSKPRNQSLSSKRNTKCEPQRHLHEVQSSHEKLHTLDPQSRNNESMLSWIESQKHVGNTMDKQQGDVAGLGHDFLLFHVSTPDVDVESFTMQKRKGPNYKGLNSKFERMDSGLEILKKQIALKEPQTVLRYKSTRKEQALVRDVVARLKMSNDNLVEQLSANGGSIDEQRVPEH